MSEKLNGYVKKWHDKKNFGYIVTETNNIYFFHVADFKPPRKPVIGDKVIFNVSKDNQGRTKAEHIQEFSFVKNKHDQKNLNQKQFKNGQYINLFQCIAFYALLIFLVFTKKLNLLFIFWYVALSIITYILYAKDKKAALNGSWRVSELTLHILSLLGGWVGAMFAQTYLNHKSTKSEFQTNYYFTVIINIGLLILLLIFGGLRNVF